jgi:hypothetical protein
VSTPPQPDRTPPETPPPEPASSEEASPTPRFSPAGKRIIAYLLIALAVLAYFRLPRPFFADRQHETEHFRMDSRASQAATERLGLAAEALYTSYADRFGHLQGFQREHPKLYLRVYRDRDDFKRINPQAGWAEAFYFRGTCHQYLSPGPSPFQWAVHEMTHQLNAEVAHLGLAKWLNEGMAEYFAVSLLIDGQLELGTIDTRAYPIYWLPDLQLTGDMKADVAAEQFIPLRAIVTHRGGPDMDVHFNTYYVHWWALVHFLHHHDGGRWREAVDRLMTAGGGAAAFEEHVGPFAEVEPLFYAYLRGFAGQGPRWKAIREPIRRPGGWPTWRGGERAPTPAGPGGG